MKKVILNTDIQHPIGSLYFNIYNTNPHDLFGGTWERIAKGRVLVGVDEDDEDFNESQMTGGEKKHQLTKDELPPIDIRTNYATPDQGGGYGSGLQYGTTNGNSDNILVRNINNGNKEHNNLQPYFTCYIWVRVS